MTIMWPFDDKKTHAYVKSIDQKLQDSFHNVKTDTSQIFEWIDFLSKNNDILHQKAIAHEHQLKQVLEKLDTLPTSKEEIKKLIDEHYHHHDMGDKLDIFSSKIDTLSSINKEKVSEIFLKLEHITTRIDKLEEHKAQPKQYFKEKIAQKIRKSSKEYVKNLTLNLIRKYERISGLKLREIIVEEQGLSSKSSFYRILEEIEKTEEDLAIMREGKEKIFISKLAKKPN